MAEFLATFFSSTDLKELQDKSFAGFKRIWKQHNLHYIWHLKNDQEPQKNFFKELTSYAMDRILEEYSKSPIDRSISIFSACVHTLVILYKTQPTKKLPEIRFPGGFICESTEEKYFIDLPEYLFQPFLTLSQTLKSTKAFLSLKWLFNNHVFILCQERSVPYVATSSRNPFPTNDYHCSFTNSTSSQKCFLKLTPLDPEILSSITVQQLGEKHQEYQKSVSHFTKTRLVIGSFMSNITNICDSYKKRLGSEKRTLLNKLDTTHVSSVIPCTNFYKPVSEKVQEQFSAACERYEKLLKHQKVDPIVDTPKKNSKRKRKKKSEDQSFVAPSKISQAPQRKRRRLYNDEANSSRTKEELFCIKEESYEENDVESSKKKIVVKTESQQISTDDLVENNPESSLESSDSEDWEKEESELLALLSTF